jgi:hypothetical protein
MHVLCAENLSAREFQLLPRHQQCGGEGAGGRLYYYSLVPYNWDLLTEKMRVVIWE